MFPEVGVEKGINMDSKKIIYRVATIWGLIMYNSNRFTVTWG